MAFLDFFKRNRPQGENEVRGMVQSDPRLLQLLGFGNMSEAGVSVTIDNALGVPAIFAAVNVISGTMASLPLHVYRRKGETRTRVRNSPLAKILAGAVKDGVSLPIGADAEGLLLGERARAGVQISKAVH